MAKKYTAKRKRTRYPAKKGKKQYGRKSKNAFYSAVPQRKNLGTNLVSDLPRVGFKPLKYITNNRQLDLLAGNTAATGVNEHRDLLTVNAYGGLAVHLANGITRGNGSRQRNSNRIRLQRIAGRIQLNMPSVDDTSGAGSVLMGGTERIRILLVIDHQCNLAMLTDTNLVLDDSGSATGDFTTAVPNHTFRKRFTILKDNTYTLSSQVVAPADNLYYSAQAVKTIDFTCDPKISVQYEEDNADGEPGDIIDNAVYLLVGHTNTNQNQFGNSRLRNIEIQFSLRTYWTDV